MSAVVLGMLLSVAADLSAGQATQSSAAGTQSSADHAMKQLFGTLLATTQTVSQPLIDPVTGLLIPPTGGTLQETLIRVNGTYVIATPGETAYNATITVNGTSRNYVVLRPDPAPPSAPLLLLLHGVGGTAAGMANLAQVAGYVSAQGFWAVMPQGINDSWNDDPTTGNDDDVQFISQLIDTLVAAGGIDATRVYAAGISNGGFMTDRLACELSDKIAGFGMVSATIRTGLMKNCSPAVQRPKLFILGTTDPIVPYQGWGSLSDIESAAQAVSYWAGLQGCTSPGTTALPVINNDGTSIELETFAGCGGGAPLELYTVNGGGHAWPGGWQYLPVPIIGKTSTNLSATGVIWNLVSAYHL